MVVKKEFAVLYKRKILDETSEKFIPFKVIEGHFHEIDHWFIDEEDFVYPHIAEPMVSGIGYANRVTYEEDEKIFTEEYIDLLKKELLETVSDSTYVRRRKISNYIERTVKANGDEYLFEDEDTAAIYKHYEQYEDEYGNEPNKKYTPEITLTPLEITSKVKETIKGQDEAIKKIVTSIWKTIKFDKVTKGNMLIIGPTGVGKTAIFEKLQKILDLPLTIFSVPGLSQAGYVGRSIDEILVQVYYDNDADISRAERSIVVLDEIDKLAYGEGKTGDIGTSGVQNELLKIIEGCKRAVNISEEEGYFTIDTSKMIFIGTGAFEELFEKAPTKIGFNNNEKTNKPSKINTETLIKYGMKKELIGRLPIVVELNALTREIIRDIILNSDESEFLTNIEALASLGVKIANLDELLDIIIENALSKGIGARGLVTTVNDLLLNVFYEVGNNPGVYSEVVINKNILDDPNDFELISKNTKKKVRIKQPEAANINKLSYKMED